MSWIVKFRLREFLNRSIWILPLSCALLAINLGMAIWRVDQYFGWTLLDFHYAGAMAAVGAIIAAMITFTGFVFSILLVAVQFASAHLSPRVLKTNLGDRVTQSAFGMFIATFVFSLIIIGRINENFVPQLSVLISFMLVGISLIMFLILINHVGLSLQPVTVIKLISSNGQKVIDKMYPLDYSKETKIIPEKNNNLPGSPTRTIYYKGSPGVIMAIDIYGLVDKAEKNNAVIVFAPAVGDYISKRAPLFYLFESGKQINSKALQQSVAIGVERTMQQDPAFVIRILVDIALKTLSASTSDPTTAVISLDKIHGLLSLIGIRKLDAGQYFDSDGNLKFEMQTPTWNDYLSLAVDEIRLAGSNSIQVVRRLRAMLDDLLDTLPEERKPQVKKQLELINRSVKRTFIDPEDKEIASIGDYQGMGSSRKTGYRRNDNTSSNKKNEA